METIKKVFMVIEDYANGFSCENIINVVGVFTDKKKAVAKLRSMAESYKKEERTIWREDNPQYMDYCDDDDLFYCCEAGRYWEEHYTLKIHEKFITE